MEGRVRSDQVLDLTMVSGGWSKCKGGFCSHGPLAVKVEIWQGDGNPPRKVSAHVWAGYPNPLSQGP